MKVLTLLMKSENQPINIKHVWCVQVGASMMDPNHFLMIVLSRFELFHIFTSADVRKRYREANKVGTDTDRCQKEIQTPAGSVLTPLTVLTTACVCVCVCWQDVVQQNNTLIEEMLHLIIMVIGKKMCCRVGVDVSLSCCSFTSVSLCPCPGERYISGVGQVAPFDEVRREIIHQLSIRPMAHSELVKALPENVSHESTCLWLCPSFYVCVNMCLSDVGWRLTFLSHSGKQRDWTGESDWHCCSFQVCSHFFFSSHFF